MKEVWKNIKGFEGLYQISNLGRVKSLKRKCAGERILINCIDRDGYSRVCLSNKNKKHYYLPVHRLVALHFITNLKKLPQTNHINGNKSDNRVENLEWVSVRDNVIHSYKTGLKFGRKGEKHHNAKIDANTVTQIREMAKRISQRQIAKKFNLDFRHISLIVNRKTWRHI